MRAAKGAVLRWRNSPAQGVRAAKVAYGASGLALKGKAAALVLTEGSRQPGLQRREVDGEVGGVTGTKQAVQALECSSGLLFPTG